MGLLWECPLLLVAAVCLLGGCSGTSWHSLRFFYTTIWAPDQGVSDFLAVGYLDDQLGGHYNSTTRRAVPRVPWIRKVEEDDPHFWERKTQRAIITEKRMKTYLMSLHSLYNLSREPPVVTVTRKADYDGLEVLICRAHGFHPKEIDATWQKDGEVWEQETFRGGVVPNSDGTYHTWLSIRISSEDRDQYRCHVEHDSLPEPLDLAWEAPAFKIELIVGVLVGVVASVLLVAGIVSYIWKRQTGNRATHEAQLGYALGVTQSAGLDEPLT